MPLLLLLGLVGLLVGKLLSKPAKHIILSIRKHKHSSKPSYEISDDLEPIEFEMILHGSISDHGLLAQNLYNEAGYSKSSVYKDCVQYSFSEVEECASVVASELKAKSILNKKNDKSLWLNHYLKAKHILMLLTLSAILSSISILDFIDRDYSVIYMIATFFWICFILMITGIFVSFLIVITHYYFTHGVRYLERGDYYEHAFEKVMNYYKYFYVTGADIFDPLQRDKSTKIDQDSLYYLASRLINDKEVKEYIIKNIVDK